MEKKEIIEKYKEMINTINHAKIYDDRGTYDVYVCEDCEHTSITAYTDLGVTPFCMKCPICGSTMIHKQTLKEKYVGIPIKEWVRPTLEQSLKLNDYQLDHLFRGGLFLKEEL